MQEIPLRKRDGTVAAVAIVDDEDCEDVAAHRWFLGSRGYAMRQRYVGIVNGRQVSEAEFIHRRIMGLVKGDGREVDHINRNKLDNRRANLRVISHAHNNQNLPGGHGISGIRGVQWRANRNRWIVRVCHNGKQYLGGSYTDPAEAARAAVALRLKVFPYAHD